MFPDELSLPVKHLIVFASDQSVTRTDWSRPEVSIHSAGQMDRSLWGRECMHGCWFQIQHGCISSNCQQTLSRRWRLLYVLFDNDKILLPKLQMGFVQQMFSARREWRDSRLETWKECCLLWTLLEGCRRKQRWETKTKPHTKKICFPPFVRNYFTLICSYHKLTSQVCCQSVDTSYGLSFSYEKCRFFPPGGGWGNLVKSGREVRMIFFFFFLVLNLQFQDVFFFFHLTSNFFVFSQKWKDLR